MVFDFSKEPGKALESTLLVEKSELVPKISVITPFYNSGQFFEQTFNCLINQTLKEFEWIIINDGSTNSKDVEDLERLAAMDCRIRVLHQKNGGQSKAKNYGISFANTDIIAFVDADDLIEPFYLELLYQALQKHPKAGWSYTDVVGFSGEEYVWCKTFSAGRMTFNNILVNAAAFRREVIESVGGFSEIAKHYDEDWALYLKLLSRGVHPVHVPVIGFWYRKSACGMQQTVRKDEKLRIQSDHYIEELSKHVDIHIKEEQYCGELPENATKSEYGKADRILATVMKNRIGLMLVKRLYLRKKEGR